MFSLLQKCCEYVFPERPDHQLVRHSSVEEFLALLNPIVRDDFVFLLDFKEPLVRAAVHEAKFHGNEKAWALLAAALTSYLKHQPNHSVLLPIPLSRRREKQRGYNQAMEIAKLAVAADGRARLDTSLYRKRDTAPQTTLTRKDRLKNVTDAFGARPLQIVPGVNIIIFDDVATTGATLRAARSALMLEHPASVTLLAVAH